MNLTSRFNLVVASSPDLFRATGQEVGRCDVANGAVQPHVHVVFDEPADHTPILLDGLRYYDDAVSSTIVYLDICALKRPFDDARSERVRKEAEAVTRIFESVENGSIQLVASPAHRFENDRNPREDRRLATALWLERANRFVDAAPATEERARLLVALGFGPLDALHLAFAEAAEARWFVTTDDQLIKKAVEQRHRIRVEVVKPDLLPLEEENHE